MSHSHTRNLLSAGPRGAGRGALLLSLALCAALLPAASAPAATACPNQAAREQQGSSYLPDCRAYELASPINKNEQEVEGPTQYAKELAFKGSASGGGVVFTLTGAIPGSLSGGLYSQALSSSAAPGSAWQTHPQNPENGLGSLPSTGPKDAGEYQYYAPDLSCGVEGTPLPIAQHNGEQTPLLAPGETAGEKIGKLYRWDAASDSYALITSIRPSDPTGAGEQPYNYFVDGASAGCARVIYENDEQGYQLTGDPANTLYEWTQASGPRAASILPSGVQATVVRPTRAGTTGSNIGQISSDGSRVFFTAVSDGAGAESAEAGADEVYARVNGSSTLALSKSKTAVPDSGARFQAASEDGGVVFFTANYGLTTISTPSKAPGEHCERVAGPTSHCDLYRYEVASGTLTDLSSDTGDPDGANVRGVLGISADGTTIAFSASGQLLPGQGNTQAQNESASGTTPTGVAKTSTEANVYEFRGGTLSYVASIGTDEAGGSSFTSSTHQVDAVAGNVGDKQLVARVSSDGSFLLLATQKQLTAYDNRQEGLETREWEQYEYAEGSLSCVSCDPSGARPVVNPSVGEPFAVLGVFVEHPRNLSRSLADDGRVFFDSLDPLAPEATNKNINAYEWDPKGVGGCETAAGCVGILDSGSDSFPSYFEDASLDAQDVYVTSHAQLAPQDEDGLRDIYDVRVNGGILATPAPPGCSGEACQGPSGAGFPAAAHNSETAIGGNLATIAPPPPPPPAAGAVKSSVARRARRSHVIVFVTVPGAGRLTVAGHGLRTRRQSVSKAMSVKVSVSLTPAERKLLRRRHRLRLTVHVSFAPASGKVSATTTTLTVR